MLEDKIVAKSLGQKISELSIDRDSLFLKFENGLNIKLIDSGQQCCELRYMSTDDDLKYFIGSTLMNVEIREGNGSPTPIGEEGYVPDTEFLTVTTDRGSFTVVNHNEHNGYYSGFDIKAEEIL
jgi:hypothetical protein